MMLTDGDHELIREVETTFPPSTFNSAQIWNEKKANLNVLNATERRWVHYQPWLKLRAGYDLRPRYQPGWQPPPSEFYGRREDCREQRVRDYTQLGTRISD